MWRVQLSASSSSGLHGECVCIIENIVNSEAMLYMSKHDSMRKDFTARN